MDELSVSRTIGLTGSCPCQASGYGPDADGMVESTDQVTGTASAVTWTYSCTGRLQQPLRPPTARYSPSTAATPGRPLSAAMPGWRGPCHQPQGPAQLCCTGPDVTPTIP